MDKRNLPFIIMALLVLTAGGLLLAGRLGSTRPTVAQETTPAFAILTGTAYRLVDQTVIDGVVHDQTQVPVTDGRIAIPELGIDQPLAADGTFGFSDLPVSGDLDNPTEVTVVFTAPGLGSFTYLHLRLYPETEGWILTPQLTDTERVNDRARAHPDRDRAPISTNGAFPDTGSGGPVARSGSPVTFGLLALVGAALLGAGAATRVIRRP